ncbi:MAG: hypothetical protein ACI88G_002376 [Woeseiaceae bacterium]
MALNFAAGTPKRALFVCIAMAKVITRHHPNPMSAGWLLAYQVEELIINAPSLLLWQSSCMTISGR